ncbi:MAG: hypothetical protein J6Z38_00870 [Lachnospiraceae bacterium]|nr:hypothetical protein [Lachnospiraceae bacterium]
MKRNKKRKSFSLFGAAVTLLTLLLIGLSAFAIVKSRPDRYDYKTEPTYILSALNRGRYMDALRDVADNRAIGVDEKTNEAYAAPYAVCDYFEACSYYLAYQKTGDAENAARYEAKMQEAYARMGTLQIMAEEIRAALE